VAAGALAEVVTEEVASNLEEVAQGVRRLNPQNIGLVLGGIGVGFVVGFYFGHRWNKEKIKAEVFKQSEEEVQKIREVYAARHKPTVEEVVEQRGYSTAVVEEEPPRPLKPPVPVSAPPVVVYEGGKDKDRDWDYETELAGRVPGQAYIIHQDEFEEEKPEYDQVEYTYWAGDDVLTGEDNRPVPHADMVVGQDNLKFGHGSNDIDVVYIRNETLSLEIEITRSPLSYEERVLGHDRNDESD
jgi:hypothetical protein